MKKYKVSIYLESIENIINPRFELTIMANSKEEARELALKRYSSLTEKDLKFDSVKLPYVDISYIDIKGVADD